VSRDRILGHRTTPPIVFDDAYEHPTWLQRD
jgi:hypothetical protein